MNQKDYKAIAEIIRKRLKEFYNQRMTIPNQPKDIVIGIAHHEDELKRFADKLADYFERESHTVLIDDVWKYDKRYKNEDAFDRKQFLKMVGVE